MDEGVCVMPGVREVRGDPWVQSFVNIAPDEINNCALVRDTQGVGWGHDQRTGKRLQHHGMSLTLRHEDYDEGEEVAGDIARVLEGVSNRTVTVDDYNYFVQSVYVTSDVISLGEEVGKKRYLWSFSARVAMQAKEPTPVE